MDWLSRRAFAALVGGGSLACLSGPRACAAQGYDGAGPARVIDGATFMIGEAEYRVADVAAPSLDRFGTAEPFAAEARDLTAAWFAKGFDELRRVGAPDRWGRRAVAPQRFGRDPDDKTDIADKAGQSLQAYLVENGAARVRPQSAEYDRILALLASEAIAREQGRGLWAYKDYRPFDASDARGAIGDFHLVRGRVLNVAVTRTRTYLNFAEHYKTDFTITAPARLQRRWAREGFALRPLEGAKIMVRGFAEWINGPSIELTHPLQIQPL